MNVVNFCCCYCLILSKKKKKLSMHMKRILLLIRIRLKISSSYFHGNFFPMIFCLRKTHEQKKNIIMAFNVQNCDCIYQPSCRWLLSTLHIHLHSRSDSIHERLLFFYVDTYSIRYVYTMRYHGEGQRA